MCAYKLRGRLLHRRIAKKGSLVRVESGGFVVRQFFHSLLSILRGRQNSYKNPTKLLQKSQKVLQKSQQMNNDTLNLPILEEALERQRKNIIAKLERLRRQQSQYGVTELPWQRRRRLFFRGLKLFNATCNVMNASGLIS